MNKEMEKIVSGMECAKNFICCKSGPHNLCHAKDIGIESYIICMERNPKKCGFSFPFGLSYLCQCPLRIYIEKNLNKRSKDNDGDMKAKVLLVDDEVEFVSTLAERLRLRQYNVQSVYQVENALDIVRNNPPDVILLDFRMPQMDGIEVLKMIKQTNPLIEVIMLTGYGDEFLIEKAISSGAFQHIMKPVDIEMLTEKIDKANNIRHAMD